MGKAGEALRLVLETYGISQNKLAVTLGIERGSVYRWVHEIRDPTAEMVRDIVKALQGKESGSARVNNSICLVKRSLLPLPNQILSLDIVRFAQHHFLVISSQRVRSLSGALSFK